MKVLAAISVFRQTRLWALLGASALAAALAGGCGSDDSTGATEPATAGTTTAQKESGGVEVERALEDVGNVLSPPKVSVPSEPPPEELVVRELSHVGGARPKQGETVGVQYVGLNYDSGKTFVRRWGPKHLFHYKWGSKKIPKSWQVGFQKVEIGDRRELRVPAGFEKGKDAHLYVIEIVEVQRF